MGWVSPEWYGPGDAEMDLASRILADGLSSRLQKTLVYDRQLASDVSSFQVSQEIASAFVVIATARPGASLADIEKTIGAEISRLAKEGPTAAELARAQVKQEFQYIAGLERIGEERQRDLFLAQHLGARSGVGGPVGPAHLVRARREGEQEQRRARERARPGGIASGHRFLAC